MTFLRTNSQNTRASGQNQVAWASNKIKFRAVWKTNFIADNQVAKESEEFRRQIAPITI